MVALQMANYATFFTLIFPPSVISHILFIEVTNPLASTFESSIIKGQGCSSKAADDTEEAMDSRELFMLLQQVITPVMKWKRLHY